MDLNNEAVLVNLSFIAARLVTDISRPELRDESSRDRAQTFDQLLDKIIAWGKFIEGENSESPSFIENELAKIHLINEFINKQFDPSRKTLLNCTTPSQYFEKLETLRHPLQTIFMPEVNSSDKETEFLCDFLKHLSQYCLALLDAPKQSTIFQP